MNLRKMYSAVICGMVILLIIIIILLSSYNSFVDRSRSLNQDGIKLIALSNDMLHTNDYIVKLMRVFVINNDPALLDEYNALLTYENLEGHLDEMAAIGLTDDETVQVRTLFLMLDKLARI